LQAQGFKLPKRHKHQKATLAKLLILAISLLRQGQDLGPLRSPASFPSLPHLSRFDRVLQKAQRLLAHLAIKFSGRKGDLEHAQLP